MDCKSETFPLVSFMKHLREPYLVISTEIFDTSLVLYTSPTKVFFGCKTFCYSPYAEEYSAMMTINMPASDEWEP